MNEEYDLSQLSGEVRGKYYEAYRAGHTVKVFKEDGRVEVHYFTLEEGAVMLEPDVREYFPDSTAVNAALPSLIALGAPPATRQLHRFAAQQSTAE